MTYAAVSRHFSGMARGYDKRWQSADRGEILAIARQACSSKPARVLDVGCGTGELAFGMARDSGTVYGVDITPQMLRRAREKKGDMKNVVFSLGNAEKLHFKDDYFDVLTCRYSMHHFMKPGRAFAEFSRVLKQGGKAFLTDLLVPDDKGLANEINRIERAIHPAHARYLSPSEIRGLLSSTGLKIISKKKGRSTRFLGSEFCKSKKELERMMGLYAGASEAFRRHFKVKSLPRDLEFSESSTTLVLEKN